jgi:hypothetical protein
VVGVVVGVPLALSLLVASATPALAFGRPSQAAAPGARTATASSPDGTGGAGGSTDSGGTTGSTGSPSPIAPAPSPTPPPSDPTTIESPADGSFVGSGRTIISGTRDAGSDITVRIGGDTGSPLCAVPADGTTTWSCGDVALPEGPNVAITAEPSSNATQTAAITVSVLNPPTVGSAGGAVVSSGVVYGTAAANARVTARTDAGSQCSVTADASGAWACVISGPHDGTYRLQATQVGPRPYPDQPTSPSAAVRFTLDTTAPAAPTIRTPGSGAQFAAGSQVTYSGAGASGSLVTVWAATSSGSARVCQAFVSGGAWRCAGSALSAGRYAVSAVEADAAQNTSSPSPAVAVIYAAPAAPGGGTSQPDSGARPPTRTPPNGSGQGPTSVPSAPQTTAPHDRQPSAPPAATPFTNAVQPALSASAGTSWLMAGLFAVAALLLLALPARMLAGTVAAARGGVPFRPWHLFGRNHARGDDDGQSHAGQGMTWVPPTFGVAFTTALGALAMPEAPDSAAAHLLPALLAAVVLVNAVVIAAARFATHGLHEQGAHWRFAPVLLVVVAAASVVSRVVGLEPALMFGVIVLVSSGAVTTRARAVVGTAQIGGLAAVGCVGWMLLGLLPAPGTDVAAFVSEWLNAVVMLTVGSAAVLVMPLGSLPGRAVFEWSPGWWVALTLLVDTLLFAVLAPAAALDRNNNVLLLIGLAAFASISIALWVWRRYVTPQLR